MKDRYLQILCCENLLETGADVMSSTTKRTILILVSIILAFGSLGCSQKEEQNQPSTDEISESPQEPVIEPEPAEEDILKEKISGMTLEEKLGQLIMIGIEGFVANEEELSLISEKKVGGVILFQRNIKDAAQLKELISSLSGANRANSLPLLIGIDEEGGRVSRLSGIFRNLPPASDLGKKNDLELSYMYGSVQASKLKNLGINLNFSPVLDVDSNPLNPVIGNRAISRDPYIASRNGISLMRGLMDGGIMPVGKHFPGHGDTTIDSHLALPIIAKGIEDLNALELIPFIEAIKSGIPAIMVGHLLVEGIDDLPATISEKIIKGLLRDQLEFNGVVFSDDMTMGAIVENYTMEFAVVDFIKAGGDVALVCHGIQPVKEALQRLYSSYLEGSLTDEDINEHILRIMLLKADIEDNKYRVPTPETTEVENLIEKLLEEMGD